MALITPTTITPTLSVVIAARNEALRLPLLLADLAAGWELLKEIVVVDGSSADASARVAALAGAQVLASPGRGGSLVWELKAAAAPGFCCCMPMPAFQSAGSRPWHGPSTSMGQNKSMRPGIST